MTLKTGSEHRKSTAVRGSVPEEVRAGDAAAGAF
jgi:hypothetical protein